MWCWPELGAVCFQRGVHCPALSNPCAGWMRNSSCGPRCALLYSREVGSPIHRLQQGLVGLWDQVLLLSAGQTPCWSTYLFSQALDIFCVLIWRDCFLCKVLWCHVMLPHPFQISSKSSFVPDYRQGPNLLGWSGVMCWPLLSRAVIRDGRKCWQLNSFAVFSGLEVRVGVASINTVHLRRMQCLLIFQASVFMG